MRADTILTSRHARTALPSCSALSGPTSHDARFGPCRCGSSRRPVPVWYFQVWMKALQNIHPLILLIIATTLEASGDAVIRIGIYNHVGAIRVTLFFAGAALLFGYGSF